MKWESLNFHLENLLPGITTFTLIFAFIPSGGLKIVANSALNDLLKSEIFSIGIFLSASYLIGIINVAVSRALVDRASEFTIRPWLLKKHIRKKPTTGNRKINKIYRELLSKALKNGESAIVTEVLKRRERGRMVRTVFLPTILLIGALAANQPGWIIVLSIFVVFFAMLLIYSYIEVTIFEECLLIEGAEQMFAPVRNPLLPG